MIYVKKIYRNKLLAFFILSILVIIVAVILFFYRNSNSNFIEQKWYETPKINREEFLNETLLKSFGEKPKNRHWFRRMWKQKPSIARVMALI